MHSRRTIRLAALCADSLKETVFSEEKTLEVQVKNSDFPSEISVYATGNDPLGREDRGPPPLHLILQSKSFSLALAVPKRWELSLTAQ